LGKAPRPHRRQRVEKARCEHRALRQRCGRADAAQRFSAHNDKHARKTDANAKNFLGADTPTLTVGGDRDQENEHGWRGIEHAGKAARDMLLTRATAGQSAPKNSGGFSSLAPILMNVGVVPLYSCRFGKAGANDKL
jgi:hypothetical protein